MGNFNADPNPLPEKMQLFWTPAIVSRIGRGILRMFTMPESGYPSERGAEAMLEQHLYPEPPRSIPGQQNFGFDSEGRYFDV